MAALKEEVKEVDVATALAEAVWPWVSSRRWCPAVAGASLVGRAVLPLSDSPWVVILLATVGEGGPLLQIPLASSPHAPAIGEVDGRRLTDGTSSPDFWKEWARRATIVTGEREDLVRAATAVRPMGVEQSNTSVFLEGADSPLIAKAFRVLHPGAHPEVELPGALTRAHWSGVPEVRAYWNLPVSLGYEGEVCSAVVSQAITEATDGFDLFVHLAENRSDPTSQAFALGQSTAQMHQHLAQQFPVGPPLERRALAQRVRASLADVGASDVPGLSDNGGLLDAIGDVLDRFEAEPGHGQRATTRIHGDLHLGQTLIDPAGNWYVLDFEGEPLRDISERSALDEPLRDVAGMLRSFDYAWSKANEGGEVGNPSDWTDLAQNAYLRGYQSDVPLTQDALNLLRILQIEKAIYEADYERRFRPHYLPVPIAALEALTNPPSNRRT